MIHKPYYLWQKGFCTVEGCSSKSIQNCSTMHRKRKYCKKHWPEYVAMSKERQNDKKLFLDRKKALSLPKNNDQRQFSYHSKSRGCRRVLALYRRGR